MSHLCVVTWSLPFAGGLRSIRVPSSCSSSTMAREEKRILSPRSTFGNPWERLWSFQLESYAYFSGYYFLFECVSVSVFCKRPSLNCLTILSCLHLFEGECLKTQWELPCTAVELIHHQLPLQDRSRWTTELVVEPPLSIHSDLSPWARCPGKILPVILWKGLTANVLILEWLTHTGLLSTVLVLKLNVPILGTPIVSGKLRCWTAYATPLGAK